MSNLNITRPPQFLDPWFTEIEQVWNEIESSVNDNDSRLTTLESAIISDVVTSLSKSGEAQIQGDVTLTGAGAVVLDQTGQNIEIEVDVSALDHGNLEPTSLLDDDHTQYILVAGTRAFSGDQSFGNNQATSFRVENVAVVPGAGNQGRLIFDVPNLALKVDDGTSFKNVGVTDHGLLDAPSLLDDDHPQYLLTDGTRAVTGDFIVNGKYKNEATESMLLESQEDDGASAVAFILDTANALNTAGALLLSVRNNGSEVFTIDKDGFINGGLSSKTSLYALIDTDNNSSTEVFSIQTNTLTPGGGTVLFEVNESGQAVLPVAAGLRIGSPGVPSDMLDVDGNADISGNATIGGSLIADDIQSASDMIFQIDTDNDESAQFLWRDGNGSNILELNESGDLTVIGTLIGGASPFVIESKETDSGGPTTGAFVLDTQNNLTQTGSVLLSIRNNAVEKLSVSKDGDVSSEGTISADSVQSKVSPVYNVLEWGLVPDYPWGGAYTDNAPALNTLIAAIVATGVGGTIYFPRGDFGFDSAIDFSSIPAGVKIVGECGWGGLPWLVFENTATNGLDNLQSTTIIENIAVFGSSVAATFKAFHIAASAHSVKISNCVVNSVPYGIYAESGANLLYFHHLDFSAGVTVAGVYLDTCADTYITDSYINNTLDAIVASSCTNLFLDNVVLRTIGGKGIDANDISNFQIYNLNCDAITGDDIELTGTSDCLLVGYNSSKSGITGIDGRELMTIITQQDSYFNAGTSLFGGNSPFSIKSGELDGVSAIGFELDTVTSFVTSGAKLFSLLNGSVEKFSIDKDGYLTGSSSDSFKMTSKVNNVVGAKAFILNSTNQLVFSGSKLLSLENNSIEEWFVDYKGRASGDPQIITVEPSEGSAGIQQAINLAGVGGIVQLKEGTYSITGGMSFGSANNRITVQGVGEATVLEHDGVATGNMFFMAGQVGGILSLNAITEDDTSIYTTTVGDAASVNEGDRLWFYGTDSNGEIEGEYNIAIADGNGTTGEIQLKYEVKRSMTSPDLLYMREGSGHQIKNLKITTQGALADHYPIRISGCSDVLIENVEMDGLDGGATYGNIHVSRGIRVTIRDCKIKNATNQGITIDQGMGCRVINNELINACHTPLTNLGAIGLGSYVFDCTVRDNIIERSGSRGIYIRGNYDNRIIIQGNQISNIERGPISVGASGNNEISIIGNIISSSDNEGIYTNNIKQLVIEGNIVKNIDTGGGITLNVIEKATVSNNVIKDVANLDGIYVVNLDYGIIANNSIEDCNPYGIIVDSNSSHVSINGNNIKDASTDGIRVDAPDCTLVGNHVRSGGSGVGIRIEGNDCLLSSNNADGEGIIINGTGVTSGLNKE